MNRSEQAGKTSLLGILGFPLVGSLSPVFQNAGLKFLGLDYVYLPFSVKPQLLRDAIAGLKAVGAKGFNVTSPFKVSCMPLLDGLSHEAKECGAVNTVVRRGKKFVGYNTDGKGFLRSLDEAGVTVGDKNVVVLGGGGAARAICFSILRRNPASMTVLTRKPEAARKWLPGKKAISAVSHGDKRAGLFLSESDLLVNATVIGGSEKGPLLVDPRVLRKGAVVFDIIYSPAETKLLRRAKETGLEAINGLAMLLWQGVFSFELWTGRRAPVERMREALLKAQGQTSG